MLLLLLLLLLCGFALLSAAVDDPSGTL